MHTMRQSVQVATSGEANSKAKRFESLEAGIWYLARRDPRDQPAWRMPIVSMSFCIA